MSTWRKSQVTQQAWHAYMQPNTLSSRMCLCTCHMQQQQLLTPQLLQGTTQKTKAKLSRYGKPSCASCAHQHSTDRPVVSNWHAGTAAARQLQKDTTTPSLPHTTPSGPYCCHRHSASTAAAFCANSGSPFFMRSRSTWRHTGSALSAQPVVGSCRISTIASCTVQNRATVKP